MFQFTTYLEACIVARVHYRSGELGARRLGLVPGTCHEMIAGGSGRASVSGVRKIPGGGANNHFGAPRRPSSGLKLFYRCI